MVLGIESSCDDTCCAVVDENRAILSDCRHSQFEQHLRYGGVIPTIARVMHAKCIESVVRNALNEAKIGLESIDAIAVSNKPGLPFSLLVGTEYAKRLSLKYKIPLIPIHHMEAHALIASLSFSQLNFPFLTLLISGGHCQLLLVKHLNQFIQLGQTLDCAPGEMLDKIARRLKVTNLGAPYDQVSGGRAIELLAAHGNPNSYSNLLQSSQKSEKLNCNFCFSGMRSNILNLVKKLESESNMPVDCPVPQIADIAASIQYAIYLYLLDRINNAVKFIETSDILSCECENFSIVARDYTIKWPLKLPLVISGGVACNRYLTQSFKNYYENNESNFTQIEVMVPEKKVRQIYHQNLLNLIKYN
ncbi:putative tRNA N6-adenosine threonylcarbamoyltransferase-like protein [Dinothrombium tinctorium]|uniref:N(6)-L-threonylcarbamoyladenine synthase n=1 Tax=Dinothrombium tinctorium TaxID=1965070 RepID=A0A3S3QYQ2_9ACAR|nr:putative tRNA N6-adenosine threonylcarbamoyltransferase-like protein [Dinothrombium tinctorium]